MKSLTCLPSDVLLSILQQADLEYGFVPAKAELDDETKSSESLGLIASSRKDLLSAMYTCRTLHNLGKPLLEASIRFDADKFTRHYSVYMRLAPGVRAVHIATAGEVAMPYWIDPVRGDLKRFFDACTNLKAIQLELPNWDEEETETRFASGGARFLPKEVHFLSLQFDGCDVKGWALAPLVDEGTKLVVNMLELRPLHFCNMEGHQEEGLFQSTESYIQADDYRVVPCFSDLEIPDPIDDGDLSYS